jgi:NADPH:quinone reductase-like Zn-dependent oxidoreductase
MARYVRFDEFGGPGVLHIVKEEEPPQAGPGQVRVRVHSAGLNAVDWKIMHGGPSAAKYNAVPPCGNGNDFAGIIDQVGAGVTGLEVEDAVLGGKRMAAQGDYVIVDPEAVLPMPDGITFDQAGSLDIAGRTAWASVDSLGLSGDDVVLVSAAAGGVGVLAAQLALRTGAKVIGTASAENHDFLRSIGVIPVEYGEGLADRVRKVAPRVTAALDNHGPATIDAALKLGVPGSRINTIAARGHRTDAGITGIGGAEATRDDLAAVASLIARGDIEFPIDTVYPLERVREAYEHLIRGHVRGKIVLALV